MKKSLTDRFLKSLKPAPVGKRYDVWVSVVPGLACRVTDRGRRTFVVAGRFPGSSHYTRRALGEYGVLTLEKARDRARTWLELTEKGVDPRAQAEEEKLVGSAAGKTPSRRSPTSSCASTSSAPIRKTRSNARAGRSNATFWEQIQPVPVRLSDLECY